MDQTLRQIKMGFTNEAFPPGTHMCLIYDKDDERRKLIAKFLDAGVREGEKVAYFADTASPAEVDRWLRELGVRAPGEHGRNGFSISVAEETYCPNGRFVPEEMLSLLRTSHDAVRAEGYPALRVSGEMTWALRGIPGSDRLQEYEALVNNVLITHPITAICQYDARQFSGAVLFDILKVHPMMVVQGQIVRNPYYVRPEEFLKSHR